MHRNTHYIRRHFSSQSTQRSSNRRLQNTPKNETTNNIFNKFQPNNGTIETTDNPQSLTNLASEYFTNLRLKAVSILSESLSPNDRNKVLNSLQAIDKRAADDTTRKSMGEAVASALAQETKQREKAWKEKESNLIQMAEQAAMERVKSDLYLIQQKEKNTGRHPVLGQLVCDLGYKRLYLTSARALSAIPVWEKQRVYRHDRAKIMAADKVKKKDGNLPGVIALHEDENGQLCILDGQHRVGMMTLLLQDQSFKAFDLNQILVEVFPSKTSPKDLFIEINKAEPIKLVDIPGLAKPTHSKIINDVATKLQEIYPKMFRPSQRCRAPHVNVDNLRDAVFTADVIEKHGLTSGNDLLGWILKKNEDLGKVYCRKREEGDESKAIEKAIKFDFYLGLDSSWLYK